MILIDINIAVFIVVFTIEYLSYRSTESKVYSTIQSFKVSTVVLLVLSIIELLVTTMIYE